MSDAAQQPVSESRLCHLCLQMLLVTVTLWGLPRDTTPSAVRSYRQWERHQRHLEVIRILGQLNIDPLPFPGDVPKFQQPPTREASQQTGTDGGDSVPR